MEVRHPSSVGTPSSAEKKNNPNLLSYVAISMATLGRDEGVEDDGARVGALLVRDHIGVDHGRPTLLQHAGDGALPRAHAAGHPDDDH